jgi:hypothetical protein
VQVAHCAAAVLGVDLIVVVALLALVLSRKRWVMRQPGAFRGAIRVTGEEIDGLSPKWRRGYGHWVRDVLVLVQIRAGSATAEVATRDDDSARRDAKRLPNRGRSPGGVPVGFSVLVARTSSCSFRTTATSGPTRNRPAWTSSAVVSPSLGDAIDRRAVIRLVGDPPGVS